MQDPQAKAKEQTLTPQSGSMMGLGDKKEVQASSLDDDVLLDEFLSLVASIAMRLTEPCKQHNNSNTTPVQEVSKP